MEKQIDYTHQNLEQENEGIWGFYGVDKEVRMPFKDREVFYFVGSAVLDNSCCSRNNLNYAKVPGFIVEWKYLKTEDLIDVSKVEPIRDKQIQKEIRSLINKNETVSQIHF